MRFIFLGPPGVGKGTIAKMFSMEKKIVQISTGDLLRDAVKKQSELGMEAKNYMDSGELVPDELVIGLLKDRISQNDCKEGFILDGFPRTIPQAEALDEAGIQIDKVVNFKADNKVIIQRLSGRRTCSGCGHIFHITNIPPEVEGICDSCNGQLFQRDDDKKKAISNRLDVYEKQTKPLEDYYRKKGKLIDIEASGQKEAVFKKTLEVI